jgi:hypothetical protein
MIVKAGQIFNLMDTNGRRNDVINALQGYLFILDGLQKTRKFKWASMPESFAQYDFYKQALEMFPDVFRQHEAYDILQAEIQENKEFLGALENEDIDWIQNNAVYYSDLIKRFDLGIEDRARHYTNNLVKLGLTDIEREIAPVGDLLLELKKLKKDEFEVMLPIDGVNVVYLRQLLKLRIFDYEGERYYSPFNLAVFALLKKERISENIFFELVQGLNPYADFKNIENYVLNYKEGDIVSELIVDIPSEIQASEKLSEDIFRKFFKNGKSSLAVNIYWRFYELLMEYQLKKDSCCIDKLMTYYEENKQMLNKAFGLGKNIFEQKKGERPEPEKYQRQYKKIFDQNINRYLFRQYSLSKKLDQIREYSDTTKRIFKASGIISFDNGFVELAYRELLACIFQEDSVKGKIAGKISEEMNFRYDSYEEYEGGVNSYYCGITSISEIFNINQEENKAIKEIIKKEFSGIEIQEIANVITKRRKKEFADFIENVYPLNKVKSLLLLFGDRSKDKEIKDIVSQDATVPTIYEYIVGIAWYYFSGKRIDILGSYNLTLSANFEPIIHAGGGQGDIVIKESNKVIMLEATLMNANSQKRGEWEPVLRHSINLKVEEETENTGREVLSFFIADNFDYNTINIWKAVASVPLQSSVDKSKFTDNVVIMPINNEELSALMDKPSEYDEIISKVRRLFEVDKIHFDMDWRNNFMSKIV